MGHSSESVHKPIRSLWGVLLSLLPLSFFLLQLTWVPLINSGEIISASFSWVPSLDLDLAFRVDGLSLLFGLIISGMGFLVVLYATGYLFHEKLFAVFFLYLFLFMGAMLGMVYSDHLFSFFVFFELTSISSYLLIGYYHSSAESRASALKALLITGGGGLALFAGLILLQKVSGVNFFSDLYAAKSLIQSSPLYPAIFFLICLGAFTKSAQMPFHIWLPGAMAAPTPVSAFLHSATMVKAGLFLMARLSPSLGGTDLWHFVLIGFGSVTAVWAAFWALLKTDLKAILAYSTVSALGLLMLFLGVGTTYAIKAFLVYLVVHSLYKGALFMIAGIVDHEAGTRLIDRLGKLTGVLPITATAAFLAVLSMMGLPPFVGFIGKEVMYEALLAWQQSAGESWPIIAAVIANVLGIGAGILVVIKPFLGKFPKGGAEAKHEAPWFMWIGPAVLASMSLVFGLASGGLLSKLFSKSLGEILYKQKELKLYLIPHFDHGINYAFLLSLLTFAVGGLLAWYLLRRKSRLQSSLGLSLLYPSEWYDTGLKALIRFAKMMTRFTQNGGLKNYVSVVIVTFTGLLLAIFISERPALNYKIWSDINPYEIAVTILVIVGAFMSVLAKSRFLGVIGLGIVGYGMAMLFVIFSAPDLAMTQFSIETLSVILFMLLLRKLPQFQHITRSFTRVKDAIIALAFGATITLVILSVTANPLSSKLAKYFAENSYILAKGKNVVNVILVDFRGFDTMGEITVLTIAAIGVYALIRQETKKPK